MADVASALRSWSSTASSNQPQGSTTIGSGLDDNLRQIQATVKQFLADQSATVVPSAGVADLSAATGFEVPVAGNSTITGFGTEASGIWYRVGLTGSPPILNNANISTPGAATIAGAVGDSFFAESQGAGVWKIHSYTKASGAPITMSPITNSLGSDVALNNTASYFDGPSVAQGTSGTWFASGTVVLTDGNGAANFSVKLWDGTTVIASTRHQSPSTGSAPVSISISGYIASPAGNIRISVKDETSTGGTIRFNSSGNSKDSTITAIRIG